ncbi:uncharacterized protein LOC115682657 [Syzygium oleosum]|uniref:uncharacterized protein LOC115682657 n=1 Tax=Syzygium oleosum TaxID=219896 RepID=UPI0024BA9394|nr:uncharacterized protein LOC115682657 [Syzygium oleosum]
MEFSLLLQNTRELWKEWEMRLLVLLSLFLQLTLATQARRRKSIFSYCNHVMIWTTYLLADSIATFSLSILSSRLANIQETKGTTNPKSQITAFWAPFLLLHLGGPDTITAYGQENNDLWLRQLVRLCIQVGLVCFIYFMALSGSPLSMFAVGMILVGFMKYAERILCLYLANEGRLRDSLLVLPNFVPIYTRIMDQYTLKELEGYLVEIDEVTEVSCADDFPGNSYEASNEKVFTMDKAYELFEVFKLLFLGYIRRFGDLEACKRMFMKHRHMDSNMAFGIVEIELGLMYDLLYTKVPLLNCAWSIIRWAVSLSVPSAILVFFSLQDKKDYAKVDICITFFLISVAILLEIYSLLLAISSDWVNHWQLQRVGKSAISSAVAFLQFCPNRRWSNYVAQFNLFRLSIRKRNRIFLKYPWLSKSDEKLMIFYIGYKMFKSNVKEWIFRHMRDTAQNLERNHRLENGLASLKLEASEILMRSNCGHLTWSVEAMEFDKSILIWHVATELCQSALSIRGQGGDAGQKR